MRPPVQASTKSKGEICENLHQPAVMEPSSRREGKAPILDPVDHDLYRSPTALFFRSVIERTIETVPVTAANPIPVGAGIRKPLPVRAVPVIKSVPATAARLLTEPSLPLSATHTPPTDVQGSPSQANDAKEEGHKLLAAGKYEDALLQFELALQIASEVHSSEFRSICHESRAICFRRLGRYSDTIRESTKALELNPKYIKARQSRGEAFSMLRNFEEAIADLKVVRGLDPSNERTVRDIKYLERRLARQQEWIKRDMMRFLEPAMMREFTNSLLGHFNAGVTTVRIVRNPNTGSYICVNGDPVVGATGV